MARRALRTVVKKRERMLRLRRLRTWAPNGKVPPPMPETEWLIEGLWSRQDNASAATQGWYISREPTKGAIRPNTNPWGIFFRDTHGEVMFNRGLRLKRRLAERALHAIAIHTLSGGRYVPTAD